MLVLLAVRRLRRGGVRSTRIAVWRYLTQQLGIAIEIQAVQIAIRRLRDHGILWTNWEWSALAGRNLPTLAPTEQGEEMTERHVSMLKKLCSEQKLLLPPKRRR